jgi:hypothetical protein
MEVAMKNRHERLNDAMNAMEDAGQMIASLTSEHCSLTIAQRTKVRQLAEKITAAVADYEEALK